MRHSLGEGEVAWKRRCIGKGCGGGKRMNGETTGRGGEAAKER